MSIGIILLAIVAVLMFFGASEKFFIRMGVANWLSFIIVLLLIIGAIIPSIRFSSVVSMNCGGFIVPLAVAVALMALCDRNDIVAAIFAEIAVAGVAIATRVLLLPVNNGIITVASLVIGFVGGLVAYIICGKVTPILSACFGGIILGDIAINFIYYFAIGGYDFALGTRGVFDSLIIASVFSVIICEGIGLIRRGVNRNRSALSVESAEDTTFDRDVTDEIYQDSIGVGIAKNSFGACGEIFDDDLL